MKRRRTSGWVLPAGFLLLFQMGVTACTPKTIGGGAERCEAVLPAGTWDGNTVLKELEAVNSLSDIIGTHSLYASDDIEVINAMIDSNGLPAVKNSPGSWDFVQWDQRHTMKRITQMVVNGRGLTGRLDLSGLTSLQGLYCSENQLKALDLSGITKLTGLHITNNPITSFKIMDEELRSSGIGTARPGQSGVPNPYAASSQ